MAHRNGPLPLAPRPAGRRLRLVRLALLIALFALFLAILTGAAALAVVSRLPAYEGVDGGTFTRAVEQVALDLIGEDPHLAANPPAGRLPVCEGVPDVSMKPFRQAFGLMRATDEGARLYETLIDNDICVDVDDLDYNAAYAESKRDFRGDWSESRIVVDRDLVRSGGADVLAAVLVHEATHIDRAVSGQACFVSSRCKRLPNGVEIDEEIAAHAAEAEWWIAAFGTDGKQFAFRVDYGENRLARAYLRGENAFRAYVTAYRSDPREGDDF